jgi:ABC-type branched-subunit amino acid transport system permease subunit
LFLADLLAIGLLTFGVYFPRHRRRDLVIAYLGINVGVLAVSAALATSAVGAGVGLGLFGVLAIIRLRSTELDQHEVAYYFTALALGLLGGLGSSAPVLSAALMALVLGVVYAAGHPRLLRRYRQQVIVLDTAFTDEVTLVAHLESLLAARVHQVTVQRVDLVNDTTWVDVRFELASGARAGSVVLDAVPGSDVPVPTAPPARR